MSATICACGHHLSRHYANEGGAGCRGCRCDGFPGKSREHAEDCAIFRRVPPNVIVPLVCSCGYDDPAPSQADAGIESPPTCPIHGVPLVSFCPSCRGAAGGKSTSPAKAKASSQNAAKARAKRHPPKAAP